MNRWLTLGANLGVLVGIILLIVELNQNREMMRAQIRNDIATQEVQRMENIISNAEIADLLVRDQNGDQLSPGEEMRIRFRRYSSFRSWENVHYQYKLGLFDEAEYMGSRESWQSIMSNRRSYVRHWCEFRLQTSVDFRTELDSLLDDLDCS